MKHQTTAIPLDSILGAEVGTAKLGDKISVTIPYGGYGFDSNGIKHRITDVENAIITRKTRYRVYCLDLDKMWSLACGITMRLLLDQMRSGKCVMTI